MAFKDLTVVIKTNDMLSAGLTEARKRLSSFASTVGSNLMNIKAGFDMALGAVMKFAEYAAKPLQEAFRFESATIQFKILMGSMDLAKKRMAELAEFAAKTPFELNELVDASKVLHTFSQGALGGIESMKLIGDAAAAVGEPFQEVAFWVGRAYTAIKSGEPFGRAALRLQELKLLTPDTRKEMEDFQATGASNTAVWEKFADSLKAFEGGMIQLSKTGDGLTSTLKDDWTAAVRAVGQEFSDQAKGGISEMSGVLVKLVEDGTVTKLAKETSSAMSAIGTGLRFVINLYSELWTRSEQVRNVLSKFNYAAAFGPVVAIMSQIKEVGGILAKLGGKTGASNQENGKEVEENKKKNDAITENDEKSMQEKVRLDMERTQSVIDNQKAEEEAVKREEEVDKEYGEWLKKQWEEEDKVREEMAKRERAWADLKIQDQEALMEAERKLAKEKIDLEKEVAEQREQLADRATQKQKEELQKQFDAAHKIAQMTVQEFIDNGKEVEDARNERQKTQDKYDRLQSMKDRGIKLSAGQNQFVNAFDTIMKEQGKAGVAIDKLKALEASQQAKDIGEIKGLLAVNLKKLEALEKFGGV